MQDRNKNISLHFSQSIVLVGFMGTGKSTIGKLLAKKIKLPFYDTDDIIEHYEKATINDIFKKKGEAYFRAIEVNILRQVLNDEQKILSTGGGIVKDPVSRNLIKSNSIAVALKSNLETIIKRLKGTSNRPLLDDNDFEKSVTMLYKERAKLYDFAHIIVNTEGKTPLEIASEIYDNIPFIE